MINIKHLTYDRSELRHVWECFGPGMRHVCPNMWEDFGPGMRQYVGRLWISHPKLSFFLLFDPIFSKKILAPTGNRTLDPWVVSSTP